MQYRNLPRSENRFISEITYVILLGFSKPSMSVIICTWLRLVSRVVSSVNVIAFIAVELTYYIMILHCYTGKSSTSESEAAGGETLTATGEEQNCGICLENPKNVAFMCGHRVCDKCAPQLRDCPMCRVKITHTIRLY